MQTLTEDTKAITSPPTENINLGAFNAQIYKIQDSLFNRIVRPTHVLEIVDILETGGKPESIIINTNTIGTKDSANRIVFINPETKEDCAFMDCIDYIEYDEEKCTVRQTSFSFHFQVHEGKTNLKSFRIDYEPEREDKKYYHAHDHEDVKGEHKVHMQYPNDTSLNLYDIDFCTMMFIIFIYFKNPDKYPLDNGDFYNKITKNIRRKYINE